MKRWNFGTLALLFLFLCPPAASAETSETVVNKTLDALSGYYKILTSFGKSTTTKEGLFYALQRLRLEFQPKLTKNIELNLTYDHEVLLNDFAHTSDFNLIRQSNQRSLGWFDADRVISDTDHVYEKHLLHRAYLKFESPRSRITFGKQLIDWGRMRFYSPLDLFNQPIPSNIEADERLGFDALNAEFSSDKACGISILYGPAQSQDKDSYGLRAYTKIATYDTFLIVAKHENEKVAGIGFDGYIKSAGFRGEFTYTKTGEETYPRFAIGADYSFSAKTTLQLEYFYNGAANGNYDVFTNSLIEQRQRLSLKKQLVSVMLAYDITPLFKFRFSSITDMTGKSAFLNPELRYNVKENLDVAVGSQLFVESKGSEFEGYNNLYYVEMKLFF